MEAPEHLRQRVMDFLSAFEARDLERCLGFFAEEACVHFLTEDIQGRAAVRKWLQERFDVNLRIVKLRGVDVQENQATLRGEIESDRIRAWPASSISGILVMQFEGDLFKDIKFGMGVLKRG